ncbi:MAG: TlpA family protein disulfide reductase [Candidatus Hydrothermarchaeales archaeon]
MGRIKKFRKGKEEKKYSGKTIIFVAFILLMVFIGLIYILPTRSEPKQPTSIDDLNLEVYYFYLRTCPSCQAVKPYITYLESKYPQIEFHKYDLKDNEGLDEFAYFSDKMGNTEGGVPFAIFVDRSDERMVSFLGRTKVLELEKAICTKLDLPAPTKTFEVTAPMAEDCKGCHSKRNLPPPSAYSCEFCCHGLQRA